MPTRASACGADAPLDWSLLLNETTSQSAGLSPARLTATYVLLARTFSVTAWLAGWQGPIQIDARDVSLTVDGDLAFVSAFNRMRGRQGGEDQDMWFRTTMCLRKTSGRWRIVCDHSSVPFYMDGSYRAAVDLKP